MLDESIDEAEPNWDPESEWQTDFQAGPGSESRASSTQSPPFGSEESQLCCPECNSPQLEPRHVARRTTAVVGLLAGATNGVVRAVQAAEVLSAGAKLGVAAGIRVAGGPIAGVVAGALTAALIEGAAGCSLGVRFGEAVDRMILSSYRCISCGHTFSASTPTSS